MLRSFAKNIIFILEFARMIRIETLRKVVIITGLALCSISDGFIFGQMSGMLNALRKKDREINLSDNEISWIASVLNATCACGYALAAFLMGKVGPRRAITILTLPVIITWVMVYYARDFTTFIISRAIDGCSFGAVATVSYIAIAEYTSPSTRAIFTNLVTTVGPSVGTSLGHILCILLHWRIVALIGLIPAGLSAILPFFYVESPSWLAFKGRFKECETAFRKLHGRADITEDELKLLVDLERKKQNSTLSKGKGIFLNFTDTKKLFFQKSMLKVAFLACILIVYRIVAGKILYSTMAISMLHEITESSDILFFTLLVDGCLVTGSVLPCILLKKFSMRSLLFTFGLISNISLIVLSACLYFKPSNNIYFSWFCASILAFYLITVNAGPYPVFEVLVSEIFPLGIKPHCIFIFGTISGFATFLCIKYAQIMFDTIGYHGVFLINSSIGLICLLLLWFHLPETKGRTLQEIELYFKNNRFSDIKTLEAEQSNQLLEK